MPPKLKKNTDPFEADDDNKPTPSESDDDLVLSVKDDDEPDDDDEDDDEGEPKPSRKQKRRERGENLVAQERQAREAAEQRAANAERVAQEVLARLPKPTPPVTVDPEEEKLKQEYKDLQAQQLGLVRQHAQLQADKKLTPQLEEQMQAQAADLADRIARNQILRHAPKAQPQPQLTEADLVRASNMARLKTEHADVVQSPIAAAFFRANWIKRLQSGEPDGWPTLEAAMDDARRAAGMTPRNRPGTSSGTRSKYTGVPKGGSAGANQPTTLRMTPEMKKMADARYPHLPESKRYQQFANRMGRKEAFQKS